MLLFLFATTGRADGVQVLSYEECVHAGYPVLKMYPPVCIAPDGTRFSPKGLAERGKACVDKCGDGVCQEVVCLGGSCPCAESASSCPKDCAREDVAQ